MTCQFLLFQHVFAKNIYFLILSLSLSGYFVNNCFMCMYFKSVSPVWNLAMIEVKDK